MHGEDGDVERIARQILVAGRVLNAYRLFIDPGHRNALVVPDAKEDRFTHVSL